jgi:flagellar biosynthetic protein FlhB
MSGDKHSKTEKPTQKRMRDARREGQIPKSPEVVAWASMLVATVLVQLTFELASSRFTGMLKETARVIGRPEEGVALALLGRWLVAGLIVLAPITLGTMLLGIVTNIAQVGFAPSSKLLKPKLSRISPLAGFKRLFGAQTAWETVKAVVKVSVLALVATRAVLHIIPTLVDAGRLSVIASVGRVGKAALAMVRDVSLAGLVLAGADYGFQRHKVRGQLMMSKADIKQEHREQEGDPHMKGAIRSKQLAASRNRMMAAISSADVVLVNPTHVAVALKYDAVKGPPQVVAKGAGVIADRIREQAAEHGIPMVADVPLARTIFRACEIGDAIPAELFDAVARVLAFIFALKRRGLGTSGVHELPADQRVAVPPPPDRPMRRHERAALSAS